MGTLKIVINGLIENRVVINPLFTWIKENNQHYMVTLYENDKEKNIIVFDNLVNNNYLWIDTYLKYDTSYKLKIKGLDNEEIDEITFTTITDNIDYHLPLTICEPFKDHIIIQRDKELKITGTSLSNTLVMVKVNNECKYTISNNKGIYETIFKPLEITKESFTIIVKQNSHDLIEVNDCLVGDVYLATGQSNMQWCLKDADYLESDVDKVISNDVRFYSQDTSTANTPRDYTINGKWFKVNKTDTGYTWFSAIAFMVGSMLGEELKNIPIGIIYSAQGDTNIASWIAHDYYTGSFNPSSIHYNAMTYPHHNIHLSGVIWYQGCNNSSRGIEYKKYLHELINNYRDLFNNDNLPFYIIQLPVYDGDLYNNYDFSFVREAQYLECCDNHNTYIIATCDDGDSSYIHPYKKRYICKRIVKSILSSIYQKDYLVQGPTYLSHEVWGDKVKIEVNNGEGLYATGKINGFMLAGENGKYEKAEATIENTQIIVSCKNIDKPIYIKYGFSKSPFLNIYNKDDMLMSPFRTDHYNKMIDLLEYEDLSKYKNVKDSSLKIKKELNTLVLIKDDNNPSSSILLPIWGSVGYLNESFRLTVIGSNNKAKFYFKFIDENYSAWAYSFIDDFEKIKQFDIKLTDFVCIYNETKENTIVNLQAIMGIELTIEGKQKDIIKIVEARFV